MKNFFDFNGPFVQFMTHFVDIMVLSFFFLLCSLPLVTVGASWTALYYSVHKVVRNDRGYVIREFFSAFKANIKQSTIIWLILLAAYIVLGTECYVLYQYAINGQTIGYAYIVFMVIISVIVMWNLYVFPYVARFNNTTKNIMKNAAYMMMANLGRSFLLFVGLILSVLLIVSWPFLVIILPCLYIMIVERNIEKVFLKYMSEEDKAKEFERNREYKN